MLMKRCCWFRPDLRLYDAFPAGSSAQIKKNISPINKSLPKASAYNSTSTSHHVHRVWYRNKGVSHFIANLRKDERRELSEELGKHLISSVTEDVESAKKERLSLNASQLRYVALFSAVPFIGFGLLHNTFMLIAGEYIDITFGAMLGITTMVAAVLGNMVSDGLGISTAGFVAQTASRLGLKAPVLSLEQATSRTYRWLLNLGRCVGVVIGCFLGMWPLLLVKEKTCRPAEDIPSIEGSV